MSELVYKNLVACIVDEQYNCHEYSCNNKGKEYYGKILMPLDMPLDVCARFEYDNFVKEALIFHKKLLDLL